MSSFVGPPSSLSMADKHNLRDQLSAQVDGLRRQVEELRQHVQHNGGDDSQHLMLQLNGGGLLLPKVAMLASVCLTAR